MVAAALVVATTIAPEPVQARAGCSDAQVREARAALKTARDIRAGAPGRTRAVRTAQRARKACHAARYALVVAELTSRHGRPVNGRTYAHRGLALVGSGGVYRVDWARSVRIAAKLATAKRRRTRLQLLQRTAPRSGSAIVWAPDPTRTQLDPALQLAVLDALAHPKRARTSRLVGPTLAPLARRRSLEWLSSRSLDEHALLVVRIEQAVWRSRRHHKVRGTTAALRAHSRLLSRRIVAAGVGGWLRVAGADASPAAVRTLRNRAKAIMRHGIMPDLRPARRRLDALLTQPALVSYRWLPGGSFYPWPRDGHLDQRSVGISVDKPAEVLMRVYAPDGRVAWSRRVEVPRGNRTFTWDGRDANGGRLDAGRYRYSFTTWDPFSNRRNFAGLGEFDLRVDTTPPEIAAGTIIRYRFGIRKRYVEARWKIREPHSPGIRLTVQVVGNGRRRNLRIGGSPSLEDRRTLVTRLPTGKYRTFLVAVDGSGNKTRKRIGAIQIVNRKA